MANILQSTAIKVALKAYLSSDHVSNATGKTLAVVISKNGGAFANLSVGATSATEIGNGWYYVDLSATDTNTLGPLVVRGTCSGVDDVEPEPFYVFVAVPDVNTIKIGNTTQTGRDIGASVLLAVDQAVNVTKIAGSTVDASSAQFGVNVVNWKGSSAPAMTGDAYARLGAPAGASVSADIAAVNAKTTNLPASPAAVGSAMTLHGSAVQAVWDALTSAFTTSGSIGKRLADNVDAQISTRSTFAGGAVSSVTGNVGGNVVGSVGSVTSAVTVGTNNDKTGYGLSSAAVQAIWDVLASAMTTAGSIGKRIVDYLTGDAYTRLGAPSGASVAADIAAINAKTANLPADPASNTQVNTRLASSGYTAPDNTSIAAVKTQTDKMTFDASNRIASNTKAVNDATITGSGTSGSPWGPA
jgi:hypothetical protein